MEQTPARRRQPPRCQPRGFNAPSPPKKRSRQQGGMLARGEISAPGCQRLAGSGGFSLGFAANVCSPEPGPSAGIGKGIAEAKNGRGRRGEEEEGGEEPAAGSWGQRRRKRRKGEGSGAARHRCAPCKRPHFGDGSGALPVTAGEEKDEVCTPRDPFKKRVWRAAPAFLPSINKKNRRESQEGLRGLLAPPLPPSPGARHSLCPPAPCPGGVPLPSLRIGARGRFALSLFWQLDASPRSFPGQGLRALRVFFF